MALRIAGVLLPQNKKIEYALPIIFGVGLALSRKILEKSGVDKEKRTKDLTESEGNKIREMVEKTFRVEGDLRREIMGNIKHLKELGTYRGSRHIKGSRLEVSAPRLTPAPAAAMCAEP